jgi:peptidoglycan/LPS O-acetylase OafA/YrhL
MLFRYFCAVMTWLFIFSIFGMMQEKFQQPSKRMRYLADATYWIYIAHLPLIVLQQHLLNQVSLPIPIKFMLIIMVTTTSLLLSYHYLVRPLSQRNWYLDEIRINWSKRSRVIRDEL